MDIPFYMSDAVWNGFTERLHKASSVAITGDKNMNRKTASDRAKKSTESPVILLRLTTQAAAANVWQVNFEDVVVEFSIYTPGTGKVSEQGRVYLGRNRSVLGQRLPTSRNGEAQLKEAGRETAERVLSLLHMEGINN